MPAERIDGWVSSVQRHLVGVYVVAHDVGQIKLDVLPRLRKRGPRLHGDGARRYGRRSLRWHVAVKYRHPDEPLRSAAILLRDDGPLAEAARPR